MPSLVTTKPIMPAWIGFSVVETILKAPVSSVPTSSHLCGGLAESVMETLAPLIGALV
jgi:hypothetical protein